jgi:hypothetical protein
MQSMKVLLAAAIAFSVASPVMALAKPSPAKTRSKITVYPKGRHWHGYGFLPGYRQPPALTDWRAQNRISEYRALTEGRYYDWYGEPHYGWGRPGYYRGRFNGGSFGPCWTSTPIGMMPTCGQ